MNRGIERSAFPANVLVYEVSHLFQVETVFVALRAVESVGPRPTMLVLRLDGIPILDDRGTRTIVGLVERCRKSSMRLVLVGLQAQAKMALQRAGVVASLGEIGFCRDLGEAHQVAVDYQHLSGQ
ncbi:MAG TPA: STAS domain-containing protein [Azoarcus taiwanensis]|nr:STAS domain-containing protein [Azoarcus taiwanensis]